MSGFTPQSPMSGAQPQQTIYVQSRPQLSVGTAYILWLLLGLVGGHQFYMGKTGRGLFYLFTFGGLFVGVVIDMFTLSSQVRAVNAQRLLGLK